MTRETQNGRNVSYGYDGYGRLTAMTDNEGVATSYEYDNKNRMTLLSNPWAETTLYNYDGAGRLTRRTNGNGTTVSYDYDETGRLTSLVNRDSALQVISSNAYLLDGVGNRLSNTTQRGADNYYYDVKYQLTSATHPTLASEAYAYDAAGNRTVGHGYSNWAYNVNNQLTGYNGMTYGYDANGNMTSATGPGGTTQYYYDYGNRPVQISFPGGGYATYKYDGQGRRIEKNVNGAITRYLYNGSDPIAEYDGAGILLAKHLHGRGWGEPLAMIRGTEVYRYHGDGLGSVTEVTNAVEDKVEQYVYDSFGNLHVYDGSGNSLSQTAIGNCFTYIGREYDHESGLYYLRARYYSPEQGRFLSRDPIGGSQSLQRPLSLSLYTYSENNPISRRDRNGLFSLFGDECSKYLQDGIVRFRPLKGNSGYQENPPRREVELFAYTTCYGIKNKKEVLEKCGFIQQMRGYILRDGQYFYQSKWGGKDNSLSNWTYWVVDSFNSDPFYFTEIREDEATGQLIIYMEDRPGLPGPQGTYPTLEYRVDFRTALYLRDGTHSIAPDGELQGSYPSSNNMYEWDCNFDSDTSGNITPR